MENGEGEAEVVVVEMSLSKGLDVDLGAVGFGGGFCGLGGDGLEEAVVGGFAVEGHFLGWLDFEGRGGGFWVGGWWGPIQMIWWRKERDSMVMDGWW